MSTSIEIPPEITKELTQILSNLVLGDNEIRSSAEAAVNERLAHTPELYILALAQFTLSADNAVMRSFSLVLLRRLLFRTDHVATSPEQPRLTLYDRLSASTLAHLERLLLHSLSDEPDPSVRRKSTDTICDLANAAMARGRPWHALQAQAFSMAQAPEAVRRESAFSAFAGCPLLVCDLQTEATLSVFERGLGDPESVDVRHAALRASIAYLTSIDPAQLAQSLSLMHPMLTTLTTTPSTHHLAMFITTLTPLASSHPTCFAPHMSNLMRFLPAIVLPPSDAGPTPTVSNPKSFHFPLPSDKARGKAPEGSVSALEGSQDARSSGSGSESKEADDADEARKAALELMIGLSEGRPGMVKKTEGWVPLVVRACLEGMGELDVEMGGGEEESLREWLEADPTSDSQDSDDAYPYVYEQALDRLSCCLGGKAVLGPAFQYIPSMLANFDWKVRHAGLMAIAAVAEGGSEVMQEELGKVVELVVPPFKDPHPRVRYAACQCVGQLCTDLESIIQSQYALPLLNALIPSLEDPEPRVHGHAAAALINFCEGASKDILIPYLDPIVERLLKLLHNQGSPSANANQNNGKRSSSLRYIQEQAITTLAMVADASEHAFIKHYPSIMPLLLDALRNGGGPEYRKLRVKAMECAGLIAIAVGRDAFRGDSAALVELLMRIQNSPVDPDDTLLSHYLISTWAKVCQALGPEFEPYLPVVMPPLLVAASAKPDVSVYSDEDEERGEGWETVSMDGRTVGIRTSVMDEKCQAFETLVIYCSTLSGKFAPYLAQTLELALPSLKFVIHDGVREAVALLIPLLLVCGKQSATLTTQMVSASFHQLISCMASETDSSFLASLYKSFHDCILVIGSPAIALTPEMQSGVIEATKRQLSMMADRRKSRLASLERWRTGGPGAQVDIEDEKEEWALYEEMEDFALEDIGRTLEILDAGHPLLVAVSSVRSLGMNKYDEEEEE
ncbi:armadillo-type protein [Pterulicium gracile]|uniref:Armadillo-type protein n=1 Tax=Pterulicium gracile TaxID=1884261 RepID=A0A5C3Q881_9AGAR|nr:armadillo-type protein [Pterula gracilis]